MTSEPFRVDWSPETIEAVRRGVEGYRLPDAPRSMGWRDGCDADFLRRMQRYWLETYDFGRAQERLNRFPQFQATIRGFAVHFVHLVGEAEGRRPLLMTHGWPGSFREFWRVAEPLAFPSRFGGRPEDAFDLVIPSLPNFGFSAKPEPTIDQASTADLFHELMTDVLGYRRFRAHGGDWGALVTSLLALRHGPSLDGIHLTMLFPQPAGGPGTQEERAWADSMKPIDAALGAYREVQGTKPLSLSWLVGDDPMRQASWIWERYHDWSDRRERAFEAIFTPEELIDTAMIYNTTGAFHTAIHYYRTALEAGYRTLKEGERITVPTAFACFPDPLHPSPPRSYAERAFAVSRWTQMPEGGHFAALEAPDRLVEDLRDWARG